MTDCKGIIANSGTEILLSLLESYRGDGKSGAGLHLFEAIQDELESRGVIKGGVSA